MTQVDERVLIHDRYLTTTITPFREALKALDLHDLAVLELGCGEGHILKELKNTNAKVIYAFEFNIDAIDPEIKAWAADPDAHPKLILNPPEYKINPALPDGDFTNYDFPRMLANESGFSIIGNPPYFLWNRVLSLTGEYLTPEDTQFTSLKEKFCGALAITSMARTGNHPGWQIRAILNPGDFDPMPPERERHCILQTGFAGRYIPDNSSIPEENMPSTKFTGRIHGAPQRYVAITNRQEGADPSDCYPGWSEPTQSR